MGNLEAQAPMDSLVQQDHLARLVPAEAMAPLDLKDRLETTGNNRPALPVPKDHPARLDLLARPDPEANLATTANLVDLEPLAPQAIKEHPEILAHPAKMADPEALETQDPQARAHNVLRLVWLLAISQLISTSLHKLNLMYLRLYHNK